jgi:SAM-dependent methyltransferase
MSLPSTLASPLTGRKDAATLVKAQPSADIVRRYREEFGYDAAHSFAGVPEAGLYECGDTGYQFFYPFSMTGDESLYRTLEANDWNYKEGKWEHDTALAHVPAGSRVLDIGCGRGSFLHRAQSQGATVTGIELNRSAAAAARARGIEVVEGLLQEHARQRPAFYDVVASFQVLEHVPDPRAFVEDCMRVLRPRGRLILGVPNNDGFLRHADAPLNGPPHHMGLWNRRSLAALAQLFPLELRTFEVEPLAEVDWYQAVMERRYLQGRWRRSLYYRLGGARLFKRYLAENAATIAGHTLLAVFDRRVEAAHEAGRVERTGERVAERAPSL